jgi:tRNA threonylcarbamoyl adenosine modification protein YeaZ
VSEPRPWLLAIDTATSRLVVAAGSLDGAMLGARATPADHRHGERLLPAIDALATDLGLRRSEIAGVIAGTGPGAFTGLRVGLATAKTVAHELGRPIVGVPTGEALLEAAGDGSAVLLLPAGPHDRVKVRAGQAPRLLAAGSDPDLDGDAVLTAVDLEGRAPAEATSRGEAALDGLPAALLRLGAARLSRGTGDDLDRLVPEYVTLPRGLASTPDDSAVAISSDAR